MSSLKLLVYAFVALTTLECVIGLYTQNCHILRDFMLTFMLFASCYMSEQALDLSLKNADNLYTMGYKRLDLLAAYCNCIYIQCMELFDLLETFHHIIEHWESENEHTQQ